MGQRLNIEILSGEEVLANAYYHWSAYTGSAIELTKIILENVERIQHENPVVRAIRLLETTGAGLTASEIAEAEKLAGGEKFELAVNRNHGLISITEKGISETRRWEEGCVEIDLGSKTVNFDVLWEYSKSEYLEFYEETEEEYGRIPVDPINVDSIPFNEFGDVADKVIGLLKNQTYKVRLSNGNVLLFVA